MIHLYDDAWAIVSSDMDLLMYINKLNIKDHGWIYTTELEEMDSNLEKLKPVLEEWKSQCKNQNFLKLFEILKLFSSYGVNNIPIIILIIKEYKEISNLLRYTENSITDTITELNSSIQIQSDLDNKMKTLEDLIIEIYNGDFSILHDKLSRICMESMQKAIDITPGADEWFRNNGELDIHDPIVWKLSEVKEVKECSHSGASIRWVFSQYKCIYQQG
jgi:hypothetical protein